MVQVSGPTSTTKAMTSKGTSRSKLGALPQHVASPNPDIYKSDNYVVLDFETTTEYKGSPLIDRNRIVLASWSRGGRMRSAFGSEYEQGELVAAIGQADFIVAHNAKFELGWLRRCGVDLRRLVVWDTMIAEHVLGGNKYHMNQLSLNMCCGRRDIPVKDDVVSTMIKGGVCPSEIPESWLQKYCEKDVEITERLFHAQLSDVFNRGVQHLVYQRNMVTPCLADVEFNGVTLDREIVYELTEEIEDNYARATAELQQFCEGASPTSTKQLAPFVYERLGFKIPTDYLGRPIKTSSGGYSVAEPAMEQLRPRTNRQREFLDKYREWKRLDTDVTKYLRKFRQCCDEADGVLRAVFNQCNTKTHRLSSSGLEQKVQFQNLAREYKKVFTARHSGWYVGEIDGSQLEFRTAVHMGRDLRGLKNITTPGFDIHALSASTLGVSRQDAKPFTFKPLYGGSGGTEKQRAYFEAFKREYSGVAQTQRGWALEALSNKQFTTEYGITFYFPYCKLKPSGYITNTTQIYNYPVQGFATAEIIPISLVCCWHRMKDLESFIVNTVHDSVIAEIHPSEKELWHELAQQCFIDDTYHILRSLYGINLTVPLGTGVKMASHWNQGEETQYEAEESLWIDAARKAGMYEAS